MKGIFCWRNNTTGVFDPTKKTFRTFSGLRGVADILGVLDDGRFLAIEVKRPKGKLSPEQDEFLENVAKRGGVATCVHSLDELIADFEEINRESRQNHTPLPGPTL